MVAWAQTLERSSISHRRRSIIITVKSCIALSVIVRISSPITSRLVELLHTHRRTSPQFFHLICTGFYLSLCEVQQFFEGGQLSCCPTSWEHFLSCNTRHHWFSTNLNPLCVLVCVSQKPAEEPIWVPFISLQSFKVCRGTSHWNITVWSTQTQHNLSFLLKKKKKSVAVFRFFMVVLVKI